MSTVVTTQKELDVHAAFSAGVRIARNSYEDENGCWIWNGCKYGHEWTPENTAVDPRGHRRCRVQSSCDA